MDTQYGLSADLLPNPQSHMLQLHGVGTLPTVLSEQAAATRQNLAAPFIAMSQQGMQNQLQTDLMKGDEFRSQLGIESRNKEKEALIAKSQGVIDQTPIDTQMKREELRGKPAAVDAQIAKDRDAKIVAEEAPMERAMRKLADVGQSIARLPDNQKAQAYQEFLKNEIATAPNPETRQKLMQMFGNPQQGMQMLQLLRQRFYENPDFYKTIEDQKLKNQGSLDVAKEHTRAASITASARGKDLDKETRLYAYKAASNGQPEGLNMMADIMEQDALKARNIEENRILMERARDYRVRAKEAQKRLVEKAAAGARERNSVTNRLLFGDKGITPEGQSYVDGLLDQYAPK